MPRLSCWFIKASLIYLALGFTFGALLLAHKGLSLYPPLWSTLPLHMEFLLVGWMLQLAFGVAFWILPRFGKGAPRGNLRLAWASFLLLNMGVWLVSAGSLAGFNSLSIAGRLADATGAAIFVLASWRRIRPFIA
jgi:hypothetical protein